MFHHSTAQPLDSWGCSAYATGLSKLGKSAAVCIDFPLTNLVLHHNMLEGAVFDKAINEWGSTGTLPIAVRKDLDSVIQILDFIPKVVQPLNKSQFYNVATHIVDLVYTEPEFTDFVLQRLRGPDLVQQKVALWLCCLLYKASPDLQQRLPQSKKIFTAAANRKLVPHLYDVHEAHCRCIGVIVHGQSWHDYTALLKHSDAEVNKYMAAVLFLEAKNKPDVLKIHVEHHLYEHGLRIFNKLVHYHPFLISWIGQMNKVADRPVIKWDNIKAILKRAGTGFSADDTQQNVMTVQSLIDLLGKSPYYMVNSHTKKNMLEKMVDYDLHHHLVDHVNTHGCRLNALTILSQISATRSEELVVCGARKAITPYLQSENAKYKSLAEQIIKNFDQCDVSPIVKPKTLQPNQTPARPSIQRPKSFLAFKS